MTTPAYFTYYGIIQDAMTEAKLLRKGQVPDGEDLSRYLRRITNMVNHWQIKGCKEFLISDQTIPLVAGQAAYTIMPGGSLSIPRPMGINEAYYADNNSPANTYPLIPIAWADWVMLSSRGAQGAVNQYLEDKQATVTNVNFYLTPDTQAATGTVHVILRQQMPSAATTGVVSPLTSTPGLPVEWGLAMLWGLADEICGGQPQAIMDRCRMRAEKYLTELENWDVENASTSFAPDFRGTMGSMFR